MDFYRDGQIFALQQLQLEKFAAPMQSAQPSSLLNRTGAGGTFPGLKPLNTAPIAAKQPTQPKPAAGPGQPAQNPRQTQPAVGQMSQKPTTMPAQSVPKAPTTTQALTPVTKPTAAGPKPTVEMPPAPAASDFGSPLSSKDLGIKTSDDQSTALPLASLGGALALTPATTRRLLGYQRLYHGTPSADTAKRILEEGLQPIHGGLGASQALSQTAIDASQNKIHATPFKGISQFYAGLEPDLAERIKAHGTSATPEVLEAARRGKTHPERIITMDVPVSHPFEPDPFHPSRTAVRSSRAITPEFIHGSSSRLNRLKAILREWPASIKTRPGRFATGLAGLGAISALGTYGINRLRDRT